MGRQEWRPYRSGIALSLSRAPSVREKRDERMGIASTFLDPKRQLHLEEHLGLFLFGLLNPVLNNLEGIWLPNSTGVDDKWNFFSAGLSAFLGIDIGWLNRRKGWPFKSIWLLLVR